MLERGQTPGRRTAAPRGFVQSRRTAPASARRAKEAEALDRTAYGIALLAAFGAALFLLERLVPLRASVRSLLGRLAVNAAFSGLALAAALLLVKPAVAASFGRLSEAPFGLVHWLAMPPLPAAVVAFLLMDLSFYYWHQLNHRVPLLWRFHNVHHIDPDLDVTTALRFHFGELALSAGFRIVQILAIGVSPWTYAVYEAAFQANTLFHHSNLRLPIRLERPLARLLVTPRMHGIHHSQVEREANSNYGVVFPWWDRLHRTLGLDVPQSAITIGVPGYAEPGDNRLGSALLHPFRRQRDYWRRPDGSYVTRDPVTRDPVTRDAVARDAVARDDGPPERRASRLAE